MSNSKATLPQYIPTASCTLCTTRLEANRLAVSARECCLLPLGDVLKGPLARRNDAAGPTRDQLAPYECGDQIWGRPVRQVVRPLSSRGPADPHFTHARHNQLVLLSISSSFLSIHLHIITQQTVTMSAIAADSSDGPVEVIKVLFALYPGYDTLDVAGPLEILSRSLHNAKDKSMLLSTRSLLLSEAQLARSPLVPSLPLVPLLTGNPQLARPSIASSSARRRP